MKRIIFAIICVFFATSVVFSQGKPVIKFEKTTHDFGEVAEKDGNVSYKFAFTNEGDAPLVITDVRTTCGCTTPEWSREPIAPKGKGSVTVTYGAQGRPGPISKTISVSTNQSETPIVLSIKGNVNPRALTPEEKFPVQIGDMRLKLSSLDFNTVVANTKATQTIDIVNTGKTPLVLRYEKLPKFITIKTEPAVIPQNAEGKLVVVFDAAVAKAYGKYRGMFDVIVNNQKGLVNNKFSYIGTIVDDFTNVDRASAPRLGLSASYFNFGPLSDPKAETTQVLKLSNSGQSDLMIRKISVDNPDITILSPKTVIKKGEIVDVKIVVSKKIKDIVSATLTVVTNDPNNYIKDFRVTVRP